MRRSSLPQPKSRRNDLTDLRPLIRFGETRFPENAIDPSIAPMISEDVKEGRRTDCCNFWSVPPRAQRVPKQYRGAIKLLNVDACFTRLISPAASAAVLLQLEPRRCA